MDQLSNLPLSDLLRELRTAERLTAAVPSLPGEEAAVHVAAMRVLHDVRAAELDRRHQLIESMRALPVRSG